MGGIGGSGLSEGPRQRVTGMAAETPARLPVSVANPPVHPPPLSLYIHIPWCIRKCPYCDFNSHAVRGELDEAVYIDALLADLAYDLPLVASRPLQSIFIGGGTPSLFSPQSIGRLLEGVKAQIAWNEGIEITLEANPGTLEAANFAGYREAGVNRLSIGVQSFDAACLRLLGRVHGPEDAVRAMQQAKRAGYERINMDLMFGLPGQNESSARADMTTALQLDPGHISYYQLTLEPNTAFHHAPPALPEEELIWWIQQQAMAQLSGAGYQQYEISAHASKDHRCRHNLNYWTFGDYLGIGAGAHGKLTDACGGVQRMWKWRQPGEYIEKVASGHPWQGQRSLQEQDLRLEYMMNLLRLRDGFDKALFTQRTGLLPSSLEPGLELATAKGLLEVTETQISTTALGRRYLNDLLGLFLN